MVKIHVIPHTHWDREWYRPFQNFRVKLVFVIDKILEILENDDTFANFMLDGQTIVLEDYLQVKPENLQRLHNLVQSGKLIIGPWYIQPDEFAPDGESLIRNLMLGIDISRKFGKSMMVGYLPDSFGQSGQVPHILKGFGINSAVVMRGVDAEKIKQSEFIWEGVNGDEVLAVYLPEGYSNAMHLPVDYSKAKIRLACILHKLRKWSSTKNILIMNGVDHQFPQSHLSGHIDRLNKKYKRSSFTFSTLEKFIQDIVRVNPTLPRLKGDLLAPIRNRVHSSIASTRIYQKQKNRRMEALLEKYVEPIATIGWLLNAEYPGGLINHAWKYLIQNQTHDGLAGCCTDEVHQEMDQRFVDVKNIGETLQNAYARAISCRISTDQINLVVFNNALTCGKQLVETSVYTKEKTFVLKDADGNAIPYHIDRIEEVDLSRLSMWTLYLNQEEAAYKVDISFYADFQFNLGYKVFKINEGKPAQKLVQEIRASNNTLENKFIHLEINRNGSITLHDKTAGITYSGLHIFEDCGDAGDTYNYSPVKNDTVITSQDVEAEVNIKTDDPFKAHAVIKLEMKVPNGLTNQDQERSTDLIPLPITSHITMHVDRKRIDFVTEVNNTAFDHRLRVLFPTGIVSKYSYAETQFGTVRRDNKLDTKDWEKHKWSEKPLPIYSQQKFVEIKNNDQGLAVLNRGLPEYEIYNQQSSIIALTLVRSVGMMGKGNLLIRPGRPSGMPIPTPDAQCSGLQTLEYSLLTHSGGVGDENIPNAAAEYDAPPLAIQSHLEFKKILKKYKMLTGLVSYENLTSHILDQLDQPGNADFKVFSVNNENLLISAVKKAEKEEALIIRLYNASDCPVEGAQINFGINVEAGFLTDFNEEGSGPLENSDPKTFLLPQIKGCSAITTKFLLG